jgi:hypothetical protein
LRDLKDGRKETTACNGATETKLNPGLIQSTEERQDILKGEAAVMPVGEPRKWHRVCNLGAERRQKRKERTQDIADPGVGWPPPAGRFAALQKWHDVKETSSGKFGS